MVSYHFLNNLLELHKETVSLLPRVRKGRSPPTISEENLIYLDSLVKENNDYTLSELSDILKRDKNLEAGTTVIFRALKKLNLT